MKLYNIYRALKAGKGIYIALNNKKKFKVRIFFSSSKGQAKSKFTGWTVLFLIVVFMSCQKSHHCDTWAYYDTCSPQRANVVCDTDGAMKEGEVCEQVSPDSTEVILETSDVRILRHYVKKLK